MKKKPFDPWTATAEEAIEESRNGNGNAVFQWQAASDIQALRPEIEEAMELFGKEKNGSKALKKTAEAGKAILLCAKKILESGLVAPDWLSEAFNQRVYMVLHLKAAHWGEEKSFGKPRGKEKIKNRRRNLLIKEYLLVNLSRLDAEWQEEKYQGFLPDGESTLPHYIQRKLKSFDWYKPPLKLETLRKIIGRVRKHPFLKK
jgi:hypothetical protein